MSESLSLHARKVPVARRNADEYVGRMRNTLVVMLVVATGCPSGGGLEDAGAVSDAGTGNGPLRFSLVSIAGTFHATSSARTLAGNTETNSATAALSTLDGGNDGVIELEPGGERLAKSNVNVHNTYDGGAISSDGGVVPSACAQLGEGIGTNSRFDLRFSSDGGSVTIGAATVPLAFTECGQAAFTQPLRNELTGVVSISAFRGTAPFEVLMRDTQAFTNSHNGPEAWFVDLKFVLQPK